MNSPARSWILGIDTSGAAGGLALLAVEGERLAARQLETRARAARALLPALDALLREAGVRREDLAAIGAAIGPGTFTGLRIGLSTAKGLALGLGIPLYGVPSLDALALEAWLEWRGAPEGEAPRWILAFRDARQGELFWALFAAPARPDRLPRRESEDGVDAPPKIPLPAEGPILAAGSDAPFPPAWEDARVRHAALSTAAPAAARLAREALRRGDPPAPPGLEPRYGRLPRAMTQWGPPPGIDPGRTLA